MANILKIKRGAAASIPQGQLGEPLFTTDTYDLYIGKGSGGNQRIQKYVTSGTSSQFLKGDGSLDSNTYEPSITAGTTLQYWRGDKSWQTLNTGVVPESGPIYFTEPRVLATVLTGLNLSGGGTIAATDSILTAFGKVQNQISAMVGGVIYQGTWNANTNSPTLTSSTGTKGNYYIVTVAGSTNLDGITDWKVGDWAIFNGTTWDKVDNTDAVSSVNGFTGAVNLGLGDISNVTLTSPTNGQLIKFDGGTSKWVNFTPGYEPTLTKGNLTEATSSVLTITGGSNAVIGSGTSIQVKQSSASQSGYLSSTDFSTFNNKQNAITLTTTGTSGAATFVSSTLNIPNYSLSGLGGVPTSRTLTINGTAYDLSADRTWSVGTVTSIALATGTSGTDVNVSGSPVTGSGTITLNIPDASASARGLITTGTQTIGGNKTFAKSILVGGGSDGEYALTLGEGRSGNGYSYVDLVGDATYTDYGMRLIRGNTGANTDSSIIHRGTGSLVVETTEGGAIKFRNSAGTDAATISSGNLTLNNGGDLVITASTSGSNTTLYNDTGTLVITTPISGTSATFSSSVTAQNVNVSTNNGMYDAGTNSVGFQTNGVARLTISSTGAATFSGNVGLGTPLSAGGSAQWITTNGTSYGGGLISSVSGVAKAYYYYDSSGYAYVQGETGVGVKLLANNAVALTIATTGAATFSSSVTNSGLIFNTNDAVFSTAGSITKHATVGLVIRGVTASVFDFALYSAAGTAIMTNSTGTNNIGFNSANVWFVGNNVGIGTNSPIAGLDVRASSSNVSAYFLNSGADFKIVNATGLTSIGTSAANPIAILTSDTERMRITSGGLVGIGTNSPSYKLHVVGGNFNQAILDNAGEQYTALDFRNNGNTKTDFYYDNTNTAFNIRTRVAGPLIFSTNDAERMRITSGGDVLIGTTSSIWAAANRGVLEINGTSNSILALNINNAQGGYLYHGGNELAVWNIINGAMAFGTNNTERMRITSAGEVLINTITDSGDYKLQVNGNIYAGGGGDIVLSPASSGGNATLYNDNGYLQCDTRLILNGSIQTSNPAGGTAKPWKLGARLSGTCSASTSNYLEVEIDGTLYYLAFAVPS